jgi:hypothetical protein
MTINIARTFALSVVSAGIVGGAALGMAGMANAATTTASQPAIVATPQVKAHSAPTAMPGWRNHHGVWRAEKLEPTYRR